MEEKMYMEDRDIDELFEKLIQNICSYHPSEKVGQIKKAYQVAKKMHEGQRRRSGEPYLMHPVQVAIIISELKLDKESIMAALLHDVIEDTGMTYVQLEQEFGREVAFLVEGVTKLTNSKWKLDKEEMEAATIRKMLPAMQKDIRVILIKLADRLHNMRTAEYWSPKQQISKSMETLEIYSPIAHRLGISVIKNELDDRCLRYLEQEEFEEISVCRERYRKSHQKELEEMMQELKEYLKQSKISCQIDYRLKHLFGIYKKMVNSKKGLEQIPDVLAIRVIVPTEMDCYKALGTVHLHFKPIQGQFKDYIAIPKQNMYRSLHTTVLSDLGHPFAIQIRTEEMQKTAEYGITAHWEYAEGKNGVEVKMQEKKFMWLQDILEWQQELTDNREFMNSLREDLDLFMENVYCFTPSGEVKVFPMGATAVDFAYQIHSEVGNQMIGVRVNEQNVALNYILQTGDRVEILVDEKSSGPRREWITMAKTMYAKNRIRREIGHNIRGAEESGY